MNLKYYFDDVDFDFEIDENQIMEFLVDKFLTESKASRNAETIKLAEFMVKELDLCNDAKYLQDYEDEITEFFEEYARDCWEDSKCYEEDKADWFGTKYNVIGL